MNRRLKLLILLLLTAVLCLSAGIASLRMNDGSTGQTEPEPAPSAGKSAIQLYEENGRWGARTENGRELIAPVWAFLRTMSDTVLIARRAESRADRIGLIRTNGELLVPFIYQSFAPADPADTNVWLATYEENDRKCCHLYKADGTRWMDETWDACSYEDGILDAEKGANHYQCRLTREGIEWLGWHEEYPVGLHKLVMDFDGSALERMPDAETLSGLGGAAARYLRYLFTADAEPEKTLLNPENEAALRIGYRYENCRLQSASVSRAEQRDTDGLPSYLMQIQVTYQRKEEDGMKSVKTAMMLTVSRNAAGAYIYSSFSDSQLSASSAGLLS